MSLAEAFSNSVIGQDFKTIAAAANNDLDYLFPVMANNREFSEDIYEVIEKSATDAFGGNYILTSIIDDKPQTEIPDNVGKVIKMRQQNDAALSDVQKLINDDYWLISKYQSEQLAAQKVMNFILSIPKKITKELAIIVKALDILAGRNHENEVAEELLKAFKKLLQIIEDTISYATNLGFPELPIIGSLKELVDEIMIANRIINSLPEDVQNEIKQSHDKIDFSARIMDVLDKDIARLINRAREDIEIIIKNIEWLPITLLAGLVIGLLQAITKLFEKLQLDFNIEDFLPKIQLLPTFKLDISKLEDYAPPQNILEAILIAIKMIPVFVSNVQEILRSSIIGTLWDLTTGARQFDTMCLDPDRVLSATYIHLLSCQDVAGVLRKRSELLNDCIYLQNTFDHISVAEEYKESVKDSAPKEKPELNQYRLECADRAIEAAKQRYDQVKTSLSLRFKAGKEYVETIDPKRPEAMETYTNQGKRTAQMVRKDMNYGTLDSYENSETKQALGGFSNIKL